MTAGETRRVICRRPFTEVLNTADLKAAKALLDPLASLSSVLRGLASRGASG
jgi:hypothetical protein